MNMFIKKLKSIFQKKEEVEHTCDKCLKKACNDTVLTDSPKRRMGSKVNRKNIYFYDARKDKRFFKTKSGKRNIPITAEDAVVIIWLRQEGWTIKMISKSAFKGRVSASTISNWINKYNLGLMDVALTWICSHNVEMVNKSTKKVLHRYVGDI